MAAAETMVADVGGVAPEGSLLMDEPLLEKADESTTHAVGSGSFTNWLAENEKSAMYALARLPALHIVFWVVTLCAVGLRTGRVLHSFCIEHTQTTESAGARPAVRC